MDYGKWPHEILELSVKDFSFSFQLWQTARNYENKKGNKQKTNAKMVKVYREPEKALGW